MLPVLLDLKFIKIYTFGIFLVLAFFWASFLLWRNLRLSSYKEEDIFDGLFLSLAGGLFLSRVVHVILNFDKFGFNLLKFILINGYPGLSLYGFVVGAFLTLKLYCYTKKIKFRDLSNYFVAPILLALGLGKLGAFFSGVEIGRKTKFLLAIKYSGHEGLRHLTPFYESIFFFLGAYVSYKLLFEIRKQKFQPVFNFYFFCWYLGFVYFINNALKDQQKTFFGLGFNGLISSLLLLTFSLYFIYYFRSLIFKGLGSIKNLVSSRGQKNNKRFHKGTTKKT